MDDPKPIGTTRDSKGRFEYTIASATRDAAAAEMRAVPNPPTYQEIADRLGYASKGDAWRGVRRAIDSVLQASAEKLIQTEAGQLDELYVEALEVLARNHVMVSQGRVVFGDDGRPLLDDGPKLAAIDRLLKVRESYRKLFGLDAATKTEVSGGVRYEIVGVDMDKLQ